MSKKMGDFHYVYNEIMDDNKKVLADAIKEITRVYTVARSEYDTDQRLGHTTARVVFGSNIYITLSYGILDSGRDYERVMFITLPDGRRYPAAKKAVLFNVLDSLRIPRKKGMNESIISKYLK